MSKKAPYFNYWGKADRKDPNRYHLLPFHCLDVAAVASVWWELSPSIRRAICSSSNLNIEQTRAWVLFFIALHDIGKFDVRFQRKALEVWRQLQQPTIPSRLCGADSRNYFHGPAGLYWMNIELDEIVLGKKKERAVDSNDLLDFNWNVNKVNAQHWEGWKPWLEAVTGHHGHIVSVENNTSSPLPADCPKNYSANDQNARQCWVASLESLFLKPVGISARDIPPKPPSKAFIAGFCSVTDWLGSANSEKRFCHLKSQLALADYFEKRHNDAREALRLAGLVGRSKSYAGVQAILKGDHKPHQVQTIIDDLNCSAGMTIIEAPTGSGKTEAALAYAWKLLNNNHAESIIFALPTQATANAMLGRLEKLSIKLFESHPNLLLAHGNARFNEAFATLRELGKSAQGNDDEAWAQCSEWLAQSRKRAFLGQIGVCTIDQVLISVLPVKHRFIRGFGLGRSVLIIDEVHAYDTYMYGLLKAVLAEQKAAGGSVVLLSATLPNCQRQELFSAWDGRNTINQVGVSESYPLISQLSSEAYKAYQVPLDQMPPKKSVWIEPIVSKECIPTQELMRRVIIAAESGAKVALICNIVDIAQQTFEEIRKASTVPVMLFHSRFTLEDRNEIEKELLNRFGATAEPSGGAILVSTQVVEQSLDVDFDWMITQLCPVDLLFQRLGRLHRHMHKDRFRPEPFCTPHCTILLPDGLEFGLHGLIYANTRVMWRTAHKIEQLKDQPLIFPNAYRQWVEEVYQEKDWDNEPDEVVKRYQKFLDEHQMAQKFAAQLMLKSSTTMTPLVDDDQHITAVTRDSPMSLTLLPFKHTSNGKMLRNNSCWDHLSPLERPEVLAMNKVSVPDTWRAVLDKHCQQKDGIYWLAMDADNDDWHAQLGAWQLSYTKDKGMEKIK